MEMNKEIKIGFFAILTILVLIVGINYLKGLNILNSSRSFHAKYENIGGLKVGSPVSVNGYQIGSVSRVSLFSRKDQKLLVTVSIEEDFDIPINSIFKIVNQDLMGSKSINLVLGDDSSFAEFGDTLSSIVEGSLQDEVSAQILPLKIKTEELIGSIDSVMTIITSVLNKDARKDLSNSLSSLNQTFALMTQTMRKVDQIVDQNDEKITSIIMNLESNNNKITNILNNFSDISDVIIRSDIEELLNSLGNTTMKINNSEGSLGMLINDKELYYNLEKASKELEELINDIKENPKRYLSFSILGSESRSYKTQK
jgi:phospholipid/cholesterol/gamma-HCH transport system substrate-binding protein